MNKEIPEWILEKLCYYDKRNPNNIEIDDDETYNADAECYCDNCFYGRTRLANELVKKMYEKN